MKSKYELIQGECLEVMEKEIDDNSIDLILCDLPYGTTDRHGQKTEGRNRTIGWDNLIPLDLLWKQYKRIL